MRPCYRLGLCLVLGAAFGGATALVLLALLVAVTGIGPAHGQVAFVVGHGALLGLLCGAVASLVYGQRRHPLVYPRRLAVTACVALTWVLACTVLLLTGGAHPDRIALAFAVPTVLAAFTAPIAWLTLRHVVEEAV